MSHEALHDEEPDQIEGNYIVVGHPVPLWQPKKFILVGEIFFGLLKIRVLPGCHICNNNLEQRK